MTHTENSSVECHRTDHSLQQYFHVLKLYVKYPTKKRKKNALSQHDDDTHQSHLITHTRIIIYNNIPIAIETSIDIDIDSRS